MLQAVLFDLDGTLANTDPIHIKVWRDILEPEGYTVDDAFFKEHISGRLNEYLIKELLPQLSAAEGAQLVIDKEAKFRELAASELTRMSGFDELYDWIQHHELKTAVVTNAPAPTLSLCSIYCSSTPPSITCSSLGSYRAVSLTRCPIKPRWSGLTLRLRMRSCLKTRKLGFSQQYRLKFRRWELPRPMLPMFCMAMGPA